MGQRPNKPKTIETLERFHNVDARDLLSLTFKRAKHKNKTNHTNINKKKTTDGLMKLALFKVKDSNNNS